MDWASMCRSFWTGDCHANPQVVLDETPLARIWVIFRFGGGGPRDHDMGSVRERWNKKYRIALGLPPIVWKS